MTKNRPLPYVILLGSLLGTNIVISRYTIGQISSTTLGALRFAVSSLIFAGIFLVSPKHHFPRSRSLWIKASFWGFINSALSMSFFLGALNYQSSGVTSLLLTLIPVTSMIMAHLLLDDEKFTSRKFIGALIAFLGAGLILVRGENGLAELVRPDWRGYALTGAGILSAAGGAVFGRKYLKEVDMVQASFIRMFSAAVILFPYILLTEGFDLSKLQPSGIFTIGYLSIVGTFLTFYLELFIIQRFGATYATLNNYVSVIFATIVGAILLSEQITLTIVAGIIIIFAGLGIINQNKASIGKTTNEQPSAENRS